MSDRVRVGVIGTGAISGAYLGMAKNFPQSSVTHKVGLASATDIDDEVVGWLKRSYAENI